MDTSISDISCVIAADDIYCQSYSDYIRSGINKLKDKTNMLSQIISNPEAESITSEFNFDTTTIIPYGTNDYIQLAAIKTAMALEEEVVESLKGETVRIDDLVDNVNEQINQSELLSQALNSAQINTDETSAIISNFSAKVSSILNNATGNLKSMADKYVDIMSSRMTCREKIQSIAQLNGLVEAEQTQTDDAFIQSLATSNSATFTGVNPVAGIAAGIVEGFQNIDLSSVKSAIASAGRAITAGFNKAMNYIATNGRKDFLNVSRKIMEFTGATNRDFYQKKGGDGTVDNCFMAGYFGDHEISTSGVGLNISDFNLNIGGIDRGAYQLKLMLNEELSKNEWVAMDIPGARVYIAKVDKKGDWDSNFGLEVRIKFRPIDYETVMYQEDIQEVDNFSDYYAVVSQASAAFSPSQQENVALEDDYFFKVCGMGKALAYMFATDVLTNKLGLKFAEAGTTNAAQRIALIALSQGNHADDAQYINPTPSGNTTVIGPTTFDDPTNLDFAERLSVCEDNCPIYLDVTDDGYAGRWSTKVMSRIALAAAVLYLSAQDKYDGSYVPYIKTNSIAAGSYYVNSDKDNYSKVFVRTAAVIAVAAVVGISIAGLKLSKNLKTNAVTANLKASISQDAIKQKILNGEAISKTELKSMYKDTKKAVRLNKLTGGFASITTGLSTWTEGSIPSLGGSSAVQVTDIEKLLVGSST